MANLVRVPSREFWHNKTVLLTGHTGFKGSWCCVLLRELGAKVVGFSLPGPVSVPNLFEAAGLAAHVSDNRGSINDQSAISSLIDRFKPDIVLHMAAQPIVRIGMIEPIETLETNILGVAKVLTACRDQPSIQAVAIVTSDKCYENEERVWPYRENEPMGGKDPYSASKGCAELVTSAFARSYFSTLAARIISVRAGNVVGGGDWASDRLIPDLVRAVRTNATVEIRSPMAVRPWQHVLEPICGYLVAIEHVCQKADWSGFDSWNFGPTPGDEATVSEVVSFFQRSMGGGPSVHYPDRSNVTRKNDEAGILRVDSTKAKVELGFAPRWNSSEAVSITATWYKREMNGANAYELVLTEVRDFLGYTTIST